VSNEAGSAPVDPEPGKPPVVDRDLVAQALEREAARVFEYCRALTGREDAAMSVTEAALNSARSMLAEPDRLRAWLADLARRQARAGEASDAAAARPGPPAESATDPAWDQAILLPDSREVVELVYRHGIHSEDLGAVLGVPAHEASALLAAAELELGRPEPPAEPDPAEALPEVADPVSARSMLPDPDRLRAWLFALARQEAAAATARGTAGPAAPGTELTRYTGNYPVPTDAAHAFPPASWWQGSAAQPTSRRRLRIAALTAIPLAAAIAVAVYLGGVSRPVGARTDSAAGSSAGPGNLPRSARPNAGLAAVAPRASASPTLPISVLLPVSATPLPQPLPTLPPPPPSPTPKPSPTPTPKPSPTTTPKPSPTTTPKSSATPKPTTTVKASATPTKTP
jgi:DNA-directed RNA polymerase specialized sigma24 family protein